MKKHLIIVATVAALAGCQSGATSKQTSAANQSSTSQQAQQSPRSAQDPASASAEASAANAPKPNMPIGQADANSGPDWSSQSSASVSAGTQSGDLGSANRAPDIQVGDGNVGGANEAANDKANGSIETPDKKSDEQRGAILTNDGAIKPSAPSGKNGVTTQSESSASDDSSHASTQGAAEREAVRGLQVPDSLDAGTANSSAITDASTLGETDSDRTLSQQIRQAVVNDETLSLASKSVQIQSSNGQVILKGQVDSEREKARIGSTAFRESGGKVVINQLEVSGR